MAKQLLGNREPRQYLSRRLSGGRIWSAERRWTAWVNSNPAGQWRGDALDVGNFLTLEEARRKVAESTYGGEVKETVYCFPPTKELMRWADILPGGCYHHLWDKVF